MKSPGFLFSLTLFSILLFWRYSSGQKQEQILNLQEVVDLAQGQSIAASQAKTTRQTRYWEWRTFQADLRPQLLLQGNLPDFQRSYSEVIQPDGTVDFQPIKINNSGLSLNLQQRIAATGGTVFANTLIQRFDDFDRERTIYNGRPFSIGIEQPLFGFNQLRWDKKIEPLRYQESQQQYLLDCELIAVDATELYFDVLLAQVNLEMARVNLANNDTLYAIAQERAALGRLSQNDLLQLQLGVLNARKDEATARQDLAGAQQRLQAFTGISLDKNTGLTLPLDIPAVPVDEATALEQARLNRPEVTGFRRRQLEADQTMARARGETGIEATLQANFGLSNRASNLADIYTRPQDQQIVSLQFAIPILDWGRASSRRETAKANRELVNATVEQDRINFEQEIQTQVTLYNMLREQLALVREADQIAQERYQIAKDRFVLGDLSITDLNLAIQEKDRAKRDYVTALRLFWDAHYTLRTLTLYDFEKHQKIF